MTTIDLVYFNAGGGHRASALALQAVIDEQGWPWTVRLVDLFEVIDPQGRFHRITGLKPEDWYNRRLARGWTAGLAQELKLLQAAIRLGHSLLVKPLQQHWLKTEPDLVVSLVPNFNRAMAEGLASALPGVPYVTVLTDLADHPPSFWIDAPADLALQPHFVCGTPRAVAQAQALGHADDHVHASSGMIVRPDFYRTAVGDRRAERERLGLDPDRPTGLVLFGGQGSKAMLTIARQLPDVQLILVCGHNRKLADALRALPASAPRLVIGFTDRIAQHMQLADFFIGKPGPGSLSEAVQQGLPVIVVRNAWTMPQERYNADWVVETGIGRVLPSWRALDTAVAGLLAGLGDVQRRVRTVRNRAVFEIPALLEGILASAQRPAAQPLAHLP